MEQFRRYDEHYEVSDLGNVRCDGRPVTPSKGEYYLYVYVGSRPVRVHEMVGKMFPEVCGEWRPNYHYHHINRNQLDNRAENIVCLSPSEHQRLHRHEDGVSVGVRAYDQDGKFVGQWESKTQASEATGIDYRHITGAVYRKWGRFTAGGYYWFPAEMSDDEAHRKIVEINQTKYKNLRAVWVHAGVKQNRGV